MDEMMRTNGHDLAQCESECEPEWIRTEPDDGRQEIIVIVEHNWLWTAVAACVLFAVVFTLILLTVVSPWMARLLVGG